MVKIGSFYNLHQHQFPFNIFNSRISSIVVYIIVAVMIIDTIFNQNEDISIYIRTYGLDIILFVILAVLTIAGQFYILQFVKYKSREIKNRALHILYKITTILQYLLVADFVVMTGGMVILGQYPTLGLTVVTVGAYGLNIALMGVFAVIFFSWYESNRNSIVVLLYALSFAVLIIISSIFLTGNMYRFAEKPPIIYANADQHVTKSEPGSLLYMLNKIYHYLDIPSFALKWIATALLLYHYSQKMGGTKYWILISLPLIYFLGTYMDDFNIYEPQTDSEKFYWNVYVTYNSTGGGILFYIGFVVATKHFRDNWAIKDYLIISGFGFLLFFSAGQTTLAFSPYPPFGFATMSFYGIATYLILLGLYASAISVSQDIELRKSIKKSTLRESKFLDSMGTAHMEKELVKRMVSKARDEQKELVQESGGVMSSLNEEDIISIVKEVEKDAKNESE